MTSSAPTPQRRQRDESVPRNDVALHKRVRVGVVLETATHVHAQLRQVFSRRNAAALSRQERDSILEHFAALDGLRVVDACRRPALDARAQAPLRRHQASRASSSSSSSFCHRLTRGFCAQYYNLALFGLCPLDGWRSTLCPDGRVVVCWRSRRVL